MKWDMPSRICDVVWNDGWSLKYRLCIYMRTISLNVNWQLCDRKMKWSMYINVMIYMNWHEFVMWYKLRIYMIWIVGLWIEYDVVIEMWCACVMKWERLLKCEIETCCELNECWWDKCVIVRLRLVLSLHWCEIWNWAWRIVPVVVTWKKK